MEKIKSFLLDNKFILLIAFFTVLLLMLPNLQKDLVFGDDYAFHLARIQSVSDSIKHGVFPVKINASLVNKFGYASSMFYPDFFLYLPSLLILVFRINVITAYKIFAFIVLCFMFLIIYKSMLYLTEERYSAIFGTIFFMLSKVMVLTIYSRFALGEFLAFPFMIMSIIRNV